MDRERLIRYAITGLVVTASVAAFFLVRDSIGPNAAVISVLPVAVVAAYFGTKWGLVATSIAFPANVFLLDRGAGDLVSPFVSISLLLIAWVFGRLHTLEENMRDDAQAKKDRLQTLEAGAERSRQLLDSLPDTLLRITDAGRIMELHGEQHLGLDDPREDVLFRSVGAAISEEWQEDLLKLAASAHETELVRTARHRVTIDGVGRVIESRVAPTEDGDAIVVARIVEGATIGPV